MMLNERKSMNYELINGIFVGGLVFFMLFITTFATDKCRYESTLRRFPGNRSIIVYADGGDAMFAEPNTLAAYEHAMNFTRNLKLSVYHLQHEDVFIVQTRNTIIEESANQKEQCNLTIPELEAASAANGGSARIMLLNTALAFAFNASAGLLIEYSRCYENKLSLHARREDDNNNNNSTERADNDDVIAAISRIHALATLAYGIAADKISYVMPNADIARNLSLSLGLARTNIVLYKSMFQTLADPFREKDYLYEHDVYNAFTMSKNARKQANVPLSVPILGYDLWTCSRHQRVFRDTWLHIRDADLYPKRAVCYSAATSIQTSNPKKAVEIARDCGITVA